MKVIAFLLFSVTVASSAYAQTCLCTAPVEEQCTILSPNNDGTCTTVIQPCTQCHCDINGNLTCPIVQGPILFYNSSGESLCSIRTEPLVQCPEFGPEVFSTCCLVDGEGSSIDVPCSLQNYRDFQPAGKTLVSARNYVQTNISLSILAVNANPATPGPWIVSYISAWTYTFEPGLPIYFQEYVAFDFQETGTIPTGTASQNIFISRSDSSTDPITGNLFSDLVAQTGPIEFLVSYQGVAEGSNTAAINAAFSGVSCLEYTFAFS